jgi:OOP family OmpA-OmpF porin
MKKWIMLVFCFLCLSELSAQVTSYKKKPSFGAHFSLIDFKTAADLRVNTLATILEDKKWYRMGTMNPALTISYLEGLSENLDFNARLTSAFLRYPYRNPETTPTSSRFYMEADANVNLKLLSDKYVVVPYLQAGVGAALASRTFVAHIPLGAGIQFKVSKDAFIHLNSAYRIPVTDRANYSLFHSIGIVAGLTPDPVAEENTSKSKNEIPADRDGDGILDEADACPDVKGLASLKGCPDSDNDGITDTEDKCPSVAGVAKYQGCPIPDQDKDGIIDENDKCPQEFGVARYDGCPVPDGDNDGINDEEDKCPAVSGVPELGGCPKIKFEAAPILFAVNSAALSATAVSELDRVVTVLNDNKDFNLVVTGYTDATGADKYNTTLSNKRADAVVKYLESKGIPKSRISTVVGLGKDHAVGDNSTKEGRRLNRRVELKIAQ